jgi:ABC-type Fe3+ transport system permease subunit
MIAATLSAIVIVGCGGFVSYFAWTGNKKGERLFYVAMALVVAGPLPLGLLWFDAFTAFSMQAVPKTQVAIAFLVMTFGYPMAAAIIGEMFGL